MPTTCLNVVDDMQTTRDVNEARSLEAEARTLEAEARTLEAKAEAAKFWLLNFGFEWPRDRGQASRPNIPANYSMQSTVMECSLQCMDRWTQWCNRVARPERSGTAFVGVGVQFINFRYCLVAALPIQKSHKEAGGGQLIISINFSLSRSSFVTCLKCKFNLYSISIFKNAFKHIFHKTHKFCVSDDPLFDLITIITDLTSSFHASSG